MDVRVDDRGKFFTQRIAKDAVVAFVRTHDQLIVGSIYVRPGYRLTDELNSDLAPFLALTDAQVFRADDETLLRRAGLLLVAYHSIVAIGEFDALAQVRPATWQQSNEAHEPHPLGTEGGLRVDEKGKFYSLRVPKDAMPVLVSAGELAIAGYIHLRPARRLRDELNDSRARFLPMTEPRVYAPDHTLLYHASFLLVSYAQITTVSPIESLAEQHPAPWLETPAQEDHP
jgi:hypothetical protein